MFYPLILTFSTNVTIKFWEVSSILKFSISKLAEILIFIEIRPLYLFNVLPPDFDFFGQRYPLINCQILRNFFQIWIQRIKISQNPYVYRISTTFFFFMFCPLIFYFFDKCYPLKIVKFSKISSIFEFSVSKLVEILIFIKIRPPYLFHVLSPDFLFFWPILPPENCKIFKNFFHIRIQRIKISRNPNFYRN